MEIPHEEWVDRFVGLIPFDYYTMHLQTGEENGLIILLEGEHSNVNIDFGIAHAINVLDEGVQLNDPPGFSTCNDLVPETTFPSTIYLIKNGRYAHFIELCMGKVLFETLHLRQYNIVTQNYVVMVIAQDDPLITVCYAD